MKIPFVSIVLLFCFAAAAQKREEIFDYSFKLSQTSPYYYVTTEKKDSGWYREAYFISQKSMALKGWYKDEEGKIKHGPFSYYHHTRYLKEQGTYVNDKKDGLWLGYNEQGMLTDSSVYSNGHLNGISFRWHANGFLSDSCHFDGQGNGVQASWYNDGILASAGRWTQDTVKVGRWNYYHKNGVVLATEDYVNGKLSVCQCYTEDGKALDTAECREKEAMPAGELIGWRRFLEKGLQGMLQAKANSREWMAGQYTVAVRFVVEKDGTLSEFAPLTQYGKGMEEEVVNLLKRSPKWTPGRLRGSVVRSYHTQPLTFVIQ